MYGGELKELLLANHTLECRNVNEVFISLDLKYLGGKGRCSENSLIAWHVLKEFSNGVPCTFPEPQSQTQDVFFYYIFNCIDSYTSIQA